MSIFAQKRTFVKSLQPVPGVTSQHELPMKLMLGQPNNSQNITMLKLEGMAGAMDYWDDLLRDRINTLGIVMNDTLNSFKTYFRLDSSVVYDISSIPYTTLAKVDLPNVLGLKADIFTYTKKLDESLTLAANILEFELAALLKVVAQLVADKEALTSMSPISSLTEIKMYSQDVDKTKDELAKMITSNHTQEFVKFGSIYYSNAEWKECGKVALSISQRLKKLQLNKYSKDIKNLTALMDRLIMRTRNETIPTDNIKTYSEVIERSSNNIAFAGATVSLCETLLTVLNQHNDIIRIEIDDYKKHNKKA